MKQATLNWNNFYWKNYQQFNCQMFEPTKQGAGPLDTEEYYIETIERALFLY